MSNNDSNDLSRRRWVAGLGAAGAAALLTTSKEAKASSIYTDSDFTWQNSSGQQLMRLDPSGALTWRGGREFSVHAYGAVGDYNPSANTGTDDSGAIQSAIDACFAAGGGTVVLENKRYRLAGPITIKSAVTLRGPHGHVQRGYINNGTKRIDFQSLGGTLWVTYDPGPVQPVVYPNPGEQDSVQLWFNAPAYVQTRTGAIRVEGCLLGCYVLAAQYTNGKAAPYADSATFATVVGTGCMFGVAVQIAGDDACVRECYIGGFMTAVLSINHQRGTYADLLIDCVNGIEIAFSPDIQTLHNIRAFPFSTQDGGTLVRRGSTILLWGASGNTVDWAQISNCFTYGHYRLLYATWANGMQILNCAADNQEAEITNFAGLTVGTGCENTVISNFRASNRQYGVYCYPGNNSIGPNCVTLTGLIGAPCDTTLYVANGNVTTVGGRFSARSSGARIGIQNAGSGVVKALNPTFENNISNTLGAVTVY